MPELTIRIFACALALLAINGCAALYRDLSPPDVQLVNIAPTSLSDTMELELRTTLRLTNPNSVALPVKGGKLTLSIQGTELAESLLTQSFELPANGYLDIALPVRIKIIDALGMGLNLLGNQEQAVNYRMRGHFDLGTRYLGRIGVDERGSVNLGTGAVSAR